MSPFPREPTTGDLLQNAARAVHHWRNLRDAYIVRRHEEGASLRTIAAEAELSPTGVQKVLRRTTQQPEEAK